MANCGATGQNLACIISLPYNNFPMAKTAQLNYYILEEDKTLARQRIADIEREILEMGPAFYEALNQTSETWHDNAPFDALREKQAVLAAELRTLKENLGKSAPTLPNPDTQKVSIDTKLKQEDKTKKPQHYLLAGHWTYRLGEFIGKHMIISCQSPLGASLLGKQIGDTVTLPNKRQLTVIELA
jgi:transcription elongation GreA/GreB family factor